MGALFKMKKPGKGIPEETYLELVARSDTREQWRLKISWHDDESVREELLRNGLMNSTRFFQLDQLEEYLLVSVEDGATDIDQELITILTAQEEAVVEPVEETVGLIEVRDDEKLAVEELIAGILNLKMGVEALAPHEGVSLDGFIAEVERLTGVQQYIINLLNGPSMIKGVFAQNPQGVYGLIHEYNPILLEAASVLRAAREFISSGGATPYPPPPEVIRECEAKAQAGETIIRVWKKYKAYTAIWSGTKWKTGKLEDTLGGKSAYDPEALAAKKDLWRRKRIKWRKPGKTTAPFTGEIPTGYPDWAKNPIAVLSNHNIKRLKNQLREQAGEMLTPDDHRAHSAAILLRNEQIQQNAQALVEEHERKYEEWRTIGRRMLAISIQQEGGAQAADGGVPMELHDEEGRLRQEVNRLETQLNYLGDVYEMDSPVNSMGLLPDEHDLFAALLDLTYTVKHATTNWYCIRNDGSLDSLMEFTKKNPSWKSEFSTPGNVNKLGNHGFVFFRVDVGYDPVETRYGGTQVMDDMSLIETDGWISLFDQLKPLSSVTMQRYYDHEGALIRHAVIKNQRSPYIEYKYGYCQPRKPRGKDQYKQASSFAKTKVKEFRGTIYEEMDRKANFTEFVFYGPQIRLGLALSLIHELRFFHRCGYRNHVLTTLQGLDGDEEKTWFLKRLISQTFRPEGKYPVALRFTRHVADIEHVHQPEGDGRWNEDGTANEEIMKHIRIIQRRKFLKDAFPQARKLAAFHEKEMKKALAAKDKVKAKDQRIKMEAQIEDRDRYERELIEVEEKYKVVKKNHPELTPDEEEAPVEDRFRQGV